MAIPQVGLGLGLALALLVAPGCTSPRLRQGPLAFFVDRYRDACHMVDLGLLLTTTPQWAIYGDGLSFFLPGGWGSVDGHFAGIGGGQLGVTRTHARVVGFFVWGYEEIGWRDFDKDDLTTLDYQTVGIAGLLMPTGRPASAPS